MPEKVSITKTKLDNLANAISAKSGEPLNLTIDEMEAAVNGINIGEENILEGVKVNGVELPIDNQKKVNIPAVSENKAGVMTPSIMNEIYDEINSVYNEIPNKVSQLTNDEGYISTETDPTVPSWAKESTKPTYTAAEVGALPDTTAITDEKLKVDNNISSNTLYYPILTTSSTEASTKIRSGGLMYARDSMDDTLVIGDFSSTINRRGALAFQGGTYKVILRASSISGSNKIITIPNKTGTMALTDDIPSVPTKVSDLTNDSKYQTDTEVNNAITDALADIVGFSIEIVNTLPATGEDGVFYFVPNSGEQNNIYDEYLYVNNAWEKLGTTEIDLSNYLQKTDVSAWAKEPNKPTYTASEVGAIPSTAPASSITNEDITSWNNKVSDDKTWNGVTLSSTTIQASTKYYVPIKAQASSGSGTANWMGATATPTAYEIARYDASSYLNSTTPSANDNSTKVATTAYVDRAVPTIPTNISSFTNDSGYLTLADLPIYDGTVV